MRSKSILGLLLFIGVSSYAQFNLEGVVVDKGGNPIMGATVQILKIQNKGVLSDANGTFSMTLARGNYSLQTSYVGFEKSSIPIAIGAAQIKKVRVVLQTAVDELSEVVVRGKTEVQQIREQAFEVEVVEMKGLKNLSVDVNTVLSTIPGIVVRESGGLGADFNFSLNGFSGNQVKFFVDGIPQDNLGTALTFNNYPANLIERVEVYKGVVPIYLGADALGGAINIITNQKQKNFVDVSYDFGSFNTHRVTLNSNFRTPKDWIVQIASFYNYADNNYKINSNEFGKEGFTIRDEFGNDSGIRQPTVTRFHDAYESQMIKVKTGIVNKKYADLLLFGLTAAANENEIQHGVLPTFPFGEVRREEQVQQGFFEYQYDSLFSKKLKVKIYGELASIQSKIIDTSSLRYDWFGNSEKRLNQTLGETGGLKTLFQFKDRRSILNTSLHYQFSSNHKLASNYTKNYLKRIGEDPARGIRTAFEDPHIIDKHVLGLSYSLKTLHKKFDVTCFGKAFLVQTESVSEDTFENVIDRRFSNNRAGYENFGFGIATSYKLLQELQLKISFENTYRIPEGYEFFGDGLNILANPLLEPEQSNNLNIGVLWKYNANKFSATIDANVFNRTTTNRLFLLTRGINGVFINLTNVNTLGLDSAINVNIAKNFFFGINATYQNIENSETKERLANEPFFFGNLQTGYKFENIVTRSDELRLHWNTSFLEEFPFQSFTEGSENRRFFIAQQWSHNLQMAYSFVNGRYNLAMQIRNITNARLFDNLNVQKPGRAFFLKFRYNLTN